MSNFILISCFQVEGHHEVVYVMDGLISVSREGRDKGRALKERMEGKLVLRFFNGWYGLF